MLAVQIRSGNEEPLSAKTRRTNQVTRRRLWLVEVEPDVPIGLGEKFPRASERRTKPDPDIGLRLADARSNALFLFSDLRVFASSRLIRFGLLNAGFG
jgi:hypothetical protein